MSVSIFRLPNVEHFILVNTEQERNVMFHIEITFGTNRHGFHLVRQFPRHMHARLVGLASPPGRFEHPLQP